MRSKNCEKIRLMREIFFTSGNTSRRRREMVIQEEATQGLREEATDEIK